MKVLRYSGKRSDTARSLDICTRCRREQDLHRIQVPQATLGRLDGRGCPRRPFYSARSFSTSSRNAAVEFVGSIPSSPPFPSHLPLTPLNKQANVRDQLRAWSVENEEKKAEAIKDGVTQLRGRKITIPQSQWLEETVNEEVDDHPIIGEHDDRRHEDGEVASRDTRLLPGDVVLLETQMGTREVALCLAKIGESGFWLHHTGKWSTSAWRTTDTNAVLDISIHNFATEEEIAPILEWLPKRTMYQVTPTGVVRVEKHRADLPSRVTDTLVQRIKGLFNRMKAFRRNHLKNHDSLYDQVADEEEYKFIQFEHLVQEAFGLDFRALDDAGRMSVSFLILRDPTRMMLMQPAFESALSVIIVPKNAARRNAEVIQWSRRYQQAAADASKGHNVKEALVENPLTSFIDKARRIILKSRRIRSPTTLGCLGPSNQANKHDFAGAKESSGEEFSEHDRMIINFIWDAFVRQPQPKTKSKLHSVATLILRAVGAYPKMQLDSRIGRLFLQELGSMAPWVENHRSNIIIPAPGQRGQGGRNLDLLISRVATLAENWPSSRAGGTALVSDGFAHIRKDLGDLQVFCIDRMHTRVVDDGFSLEPCKDKAGTWWIHLHIAHPSAFFDPGHPIAQAARALGATQYASGTNHFMIDHRISSYLSIRRGAATLTVSTLVNEDGEVLDIKVVPTKVNNVTHLLKEVVSHLMGTEHPPVAHIVVGPDSRITPFVPGENFAQEDMESTKQHLPLLDQMHTLLLARFRRRQKEVPIAANYYSPDSLRACSVNFEEPNDRNRLNESFHYLSDPTIRIFTTVHSLLVRAADRDLRADITTHAVWLCCESFGKWLSDRKIPAVFHGAQTTAGYSVEMLNTMEQDDRIMYPSPNIQAEAVPHIAMNMQQFCRITSPLRRYPDLISQWNADAYLRAEAEGIVQPGAPAANHQFPYSKEAVQEYLRSDFWVIKYAEVQQRLSFIHWAFQAFFRAFHFREAVLPELWDVEISTSLVRKDRHIDATGQLGELKPFQLRCFILESAEKYEQRAKIKQYLPCKIELVDVNEKYIAVRAVGEPTDMPQFEVKDVVTPKEKRIEQKGFTSPIREKEKFQSEQEG